MGFRKFFSIVSLFILLSQIPGVVLASVTKNFSTNKYKGNNETLSTWKFEAEVGNYLGYNFDKREVGVLGEAKISLESTIRKKGDIDFYNPSSFSGKILVKDLEIKSYFDQDSLPDEAFAADFPLNISWGNIEGWVFLGPFYFRLNYNNHDRLDLVDSFDDEDLDFSVINYSLIELRDTATYKGSISNAVGAVLQFEIDNERGLVGDDFIENTQGSFNFGYKVGDIFDIRLGASTRVGYLDADIGNEYNPIAFSASTRIKFDDFEKFSFFIFNIKAAGSTGVSNLPFLEEDNPFYLGGSLRYRIPVANGKFGIIPGIGVEAEIEYKQKIQNFTSFQTNLPDPSRNTWILTQSYEAIAGLIFDWSALGRSEHDAEDNLFVFTQGSTDKARDGSSISLGFGYVPNVVFRQMRVPYLGLKVAMWDSEDTENHRRGLIPFLETVIVMNINHTFGGELGGFHKEILVYRDTINSSFVRINGRTDFAVGFQGKYRMAFLQPYANVFFKNLDIFREKDIYDIENFRFEERRFYDNKADLRVKVGTEVVGLIQNVIFDAYWESGDIIKGNIVTQELTDYDFFSSTNAAGENIFVSHAKYGFIALGAKIRF